MENKLFIVDDWGMSPAINEAALYLAEHGYLYGISVVPYSRFYSHKLKEILDTGVKIGCHVNFTFDPSPGNPPTKFQWIFVTLKILKAIFRSLVTFRQTSLSLQEQIHWVQTHAGRVDYLDGHHHIHLYPGLLGISRKVCFDLGIPFRIVSDRKFISNFLLGLFAKSLCKKADYIECLYLTPQEYTNELLLREKLKNSRDGLLIAIHPATREDFIENGVQDHYIQGRVCQFQRIKDTLGI